MPLVTPEEMDKLLGVAPIEERAASKLQVELPPEIVKAEEPIAAPAPQIPETQDVSEQEVLKILAGEHDKEYEPLDLKDSIELLYAFHPQVSTGQVRLYDWQIQTNEFLCNPVAFTRDFPLHFILCACNGSGKDAFVIGPFAVWHCVSKARSRCIITSSSFNQLKNQTEPSIRTIANAINKHFGENILIIKQFHIVCKSTGSEILMFATDDPGMAEGYHPWADHAGAEMALVVNEAKTVQEDIFGALRRCNGYNRWIEVSSPGRMSGHLYNMARKATVYPEKYKRKETAWYFRRITATDCPHISKAVIEDDKQTLGESSPLFRSMYLAEFTDISENPVIPAELIERVLDNDKIEHKPGKYGCTAGIDLAFGGEDDNVGYIINGNKILDRYSFKGIIDTIEIKNRWKIKLDEWKAVHGLKPECVRMDHGNAGRSIIDMLRREGWLGIIEVLNQTAAMNSQLYGNRGTELYFIVKRLIEEKCMRLDSKYTKLVDQLRSRRYREHATMRGKLIVEPKKEAKAQGRPSPNDADAFVLACASLELRDFLADAPKAETREGLTLEEVQNRIEQGEVLHDRTSKPRLNFRGHFNSLSSVLKNRQPISKL